jgi:hypothetical protein
VLDSFLGAVYPFVDDFGGNQIQLGQLGLHPSQAFRSAGSVTRYIMEDKEEISQLLLKLDAWIAYEEAQEKKKKKEEEKKRKEESKRRQEARTKKLEDDVIALERKLEMMEKRDQALLDLIEAQIALEEAEMKEKSCPLEGQEEKTDAGEEQMVVDEPWVEKVLVEDKYAEKIVDLGKGD